MRASRTPLLLLPAGLTAGHAAGYLVAGGPHHGASDAGAHGYVPLLLRLAVPLAAGALAGAVARGRRHAAPRPLRWDRLALHLAALFLLVEVAEHAVAGVGPAHVLHAPSTAWGLLGQLVAAWALTTLVRVAHRAGQWVAPAAPAAPAGGAPPRSRRAHADRPVARDAAATWAHLRAPPAPRLAAAR
jgi:hypothetical protein